MKLSIQFAVVNPNLFRETTAVYKPTPDTSNWLKLAKKNATIADGMMLRHFSQLLLL